LRGNLSGNAGEKTAEIIDLCNIVHIENDHRFPEKREMSRKVLLEHLGSCSGNYRPVNLEELNNKIGRYMGNSSQEVSSVVRQEIVKFIDQKGAKVHWIDYVSTFAGVAGAVVGTAGLVVVLTGCSIM